VSTLIPESVLLPGGASVGGRGRCFVPTPGHASSLQDRSRIFEWFPEPSRLFENFFFFTYLSRGKKRFICSLFLFLSQPAGPALLGICRELGIVFVIFGIRGFQDSRGKIKIHKILNYNDLILGFCLCDIYLVIMKWNKMK